MYINIITLTLLSSIINYFFGKLIGIKGTKYFNLLFMFLTWIIALIIFYEVNLCNSICYINLLPWITPINLNWNFYYDSITSIMLFVITSISFLVHIYSIEYMENDPALPKFMSFLSFFTFTMILMVTSNNYLQMFFGWEGVGFASFLLIGFWHTRVNAIKSALKAVIINRIGDLSLYVAIGFIWINTMTLNYDILFNISYLLNLEYFNIGFFNLSITNWITLFLFFGAVAKSAQIGLHTWLPDAMEGPTPVSALLHAATMVTAGVFLIIRSSPIFEYNPNALLIITLFGGLTTFMAGTIGMLQNDIKKVIAYSTCSQLGYMVLICGLSNYSLSLFHLTNHAFFKALLFLSSGVIIHALNDEQDMRKMGGLIKLLPLTYIMILIGSLALMGFPFLTGFYSKDIILEITFANLNFKFNSFIYLLAIMSAFFTSFYSVRLLYFVFLKETSVGKNMIKNIHEGGLFMTIPLFILGLLSIFIGYSFKELFMGIGVDIWNNSILTLNNNIYIFEAEFLPIYIKLLPFFVSILGTCIGLLIYYKFNYYSLKIIFNYYIIYSIYNFCNKKWYFDNIYNNFLIKNYITKGYDNFYKEFEQGFIFHNMIVFSKNFIMYITEIFRKLQTGRIYNYSFQMIFGIYMVLILTMYNTLNMNITNYILLTVFSIASLYLKVKKSY